MCKECYMANAAAKQEQEKADEPRRKLNRVILDNHILLNKIDKAIKDAV